MALILGTLLVMIAGSDPVLSTLAGSHVDTLEHGGIERSFGYCLPRGHDVPAGLPLVFVLHGGGGSARSTARLTGFNRLADSEGFIVVYPEAVNRRWNDGRGVKWFRSQRENVDDVGFIVGLADLFVAQGMADPGRVYAAGISNGGMMCLRLGLESGSKFAAIAAVAAGMPEQGSPNFERRTSNFHRQPAAGSREEPVSLMMVNGTEDPLVPFAGGWVGLLKKRGRVKSVEEAVRFWVERNRCDSRPVRAVVPDRDPDDGMRVRVETYSGGSSGSEVVLYTVEGGGHTWPGGVERPASFGRRCDDIDATRVIWEFFSRHRR